MESFERIFSAFFLVHFGYMVEKKNSVYSLNAHLIRTRKIAKILWESLWQNKAAKMHI